MNIKTIGYIAIGFLLVSGILYAYNLYKENERLQYQNTLITQNQTALQDSLEQVADSIAVLAVSIRDLNEDISNTEIAYIALKNKYNIILDSLHDSGHGYTTVTDTSIKVTFNGKRGITSFDGYTLTDINNKEYTSTWDLRMWWDTIGVTSEIIKEGVLWKIKTISQNPEVKLIGYTTIDEKTYELLQKYSPPVSPKTIGIGFIGTKDAISGGIMLRIRDYYSIIGYRVTNMYDSWNQNIMLGIFKPLF